MFGSLFTSRRLRAVAVHFACSAAIASLISLLVFLMWYPPPFDAISGGTMLFFLVVGVDVVLGPTLTGVVASQSKPTPELRRDIAVIVLLQLAGMAYGLYSMALARPILLSFEIDRFRVVAAADIETNQLLEAPIGMRQLSWTGPSTIAAVKPTNAEEQIKSVELGLAGLDLSMIPSNWRNYADQRSAVLKVSRPASTLTAQYPRAAGAISQMAEKAGLDTQMLRFLPLVARHANWVTLISSSDARVVGHLPLDGFF
jgi:hypothetical protein